MPLRHAFLIALIFLAGVFMKKAGWAVGSMSMYLAAVLTLLAGLRYVIKYKDGSRIIPPALASLFMITAAFQLQYRFRPDVADGWICFIALMLCIGLLRMKKPASSIALTAIPLTTIIIAGFSDMRTYHDIFHSRPFEAFIRSKYTFTERTIADSIVSRYTLVNKDKAVELMTEAKQMEKERMENALLIFDRSIDADPFNSTHYDLRGYYKLSTFSIERKENLYDALKDFQRAVDLDSTNGQAQFHRAQVYGLLGRGKLACEGFKKAKSIDPELNTETFEKRYCRF